MRCARGTRSRHIRATGMRIKLKKEEGEDTVKKEEGACLVCGRPLVYFEKAQEMECAICHGKFRSCASCEAGHFVCDRCHGEQGIRDVIAYCMQSSSRNPIAMMQEMMEDPYIHMHGPEHHVMVGARFSAHTATAAGKSNWKRRLEKWRSAAQSIQADPAAIGVVAARL